MRAIPVKTDQPIKLSRKQIQELYLEIQSKIGVLLAADTATPAIQEALRSFSTQLFRTKREWIGINDEIKSE